MTMPTTRGSKSIALRHSVNKLIIDRRTREEATETNTKCDNSRNAKARYYRNRGAGAAVGFVRKMRGEA